MRTLKSDILIKTLRDGQGMVEQARRFWRDSLVQEPLDFDARIRLVRLEVEQGDGAIAWNLLEESFILLMDIRPTVPLRTAGLQVEEWITALRFLPHYQLFRERYPVSDYWNQEDPLYDLPFPPPMTDQIKTALTTYLSIPFGLGFHLLAEAENRENREVLREFFETVRPRIEHALVESARYLTDFITSKSNSTKAVSDSLTEVILFLGLVSLREFGRQRGWITGEFRISPEVLNNALMDYDESQIEVHVVTGALLTLNEEIGFAPISDAKKQKNDNG